MKFRKRTHFQSASKTSNLIRNTQVVEAGGHFGATAAIALLHQGLGFKVNPNCFGKIACEDAIVKIA